jgi:hypothetical protein
MCCRRAGRPSPKDMWRTLTCDQPKLLSDSASRHRLNLAQHDARSRPIAARCGSSALKARGAKLHHPIDTDESAEVRVELLFGAPRYRAE